MNTDDIVDDATVPRADRAQEPRPPPRAADNSSAHGGPKKVQQPKPQSLGTRTTTSVILVSPRQKGNPVLDNIRSIGWEYSDIPADFVLGSTTCALFLSLKYHRLHPEYIYTRIKNLGGKYNLRIVLVMVDIENHEQPLKELSKTSIINNVTVILSWSAAEAGRYLELYKNFEHAAPTSIRGIQSSSYADQLVDFVTVPRSINKTDAISLVSTFGSIRTSINAQPEELAQIAGWGQKKIDQWNGNVHQPFRTETATKRGVIDAGGITPALSRDVSRVETGSPLFLSRETSTVGNANLAGETSAAMPIAVDHLGPEVDVDEEEAMLQHETPIVVPSVKRKAPEDDLSEGVATALARLRKT